MYDKGQAFGYQSISLSNSNPSGFTIPVPQAEAALIRVETNNMRFRLDGVAASATSGYLLMSSDTQGFWIWGAGNLKNFSAIATTTGTTNLDVIYFGLAES